MRHDSETNENNFEARARHKRPSFLGEFWGFLNHNKKWWLLPMLAVILALGILVLVGGSPLGPFIYTLF